MAMTGTLAEVSLVDLIQVICQERHAARLMVENANGSASVFIDNGEIVHAASGALEGRAALHRVLAWKEGSFRLDNGIKAAKRTIAGSTTANLLEGIERLDLSRVSAAGPRSVETVRRAQPAPHLVTSTQPSATEVPEPDLLHQLQSIPGVQQVILVRKDGVALPQASSEQSEEDGALAAFLGNAGLGVSKALHLGELKTIRADVAGESRMVLPHEAGFVGLHLSDRSRQASAASQAEEILRTSR